VKEESEVVNGRPRGRNGKGEVRVFDEDHGMEGEEEGRTGSRDKGGWCVFTLDEMVGENPIFKFGLDAPVISSLIRSAIKP
jgi:hypothetical protein